MGEKLVPRTQKSEVNLDIQSSDISAVEQRVSEVIPVPDSLGKETTFIGLYTTRCSRNAME